MEKNVKKPVDESILRAVFAAATIGFFIPFDFYIANINELLLPIKYVVTAIAVTSVLIFAGVFLSDRLISKRNSAAARIINTLIFAVTLGSYIQGSFLSVNMGEMNGSRYSPGALSVIINILLWCALLTGIVIWDRKKPGIYQKIVPYLSAAITVIEIVTAAVSYVLIYTTYATDVAPLGIWIRDKDTFVCSMSGIDTYSSKENFIIILADEYDSFVLDSAAEQCPEALEGFDGFTYYRNTVGMYGNTIEAVAYIFTGCKNVPDPYSHDDFFNNLSKRYEVCLYAGPSQFFDKKIYEKYAANYIPADFTAGDMIRMQRMLLKATMFKCSPEIFKSAFWFSNDDFSRIIGGTDDIRPYMPDDLAFYSNIPQEAKLTDESCFKLIYLYGIHEPRNITADLQRTKDWRISPEEQAIAVNKIVTKYFEYLKESGVYDNSTIIFLADHGLKNNYNGRYPMLMYKPANAENKGITVSDAPISHADLYPTLIALSGGTPDGRTIFEIGENEQRERYFGGLFAGTNIELITGRL